MVESCGEMKSSILNSQWRSFIFEAKSIIPISIKTIHEALGDNKIAPLNSGDQFTRISFLGSQILFIVWCVSLCRQNFMFR